jgi:hypothetical protein
MAALSASVHNPTLRLFYQRLRAAITRRASRTSKRWWLSRASS